MMCDFACQFQMRQLVFTDRNGIRFIEKNVGSLQNRNYTLMLYTAGALALIGALVVLPIKGVR